MAQSANVSSVDPRVRAYFVPTPAGVAFAVSRPGNDPHRAILFALLNGAVDEAAPLLRLAADAGIDDKKALGVALFELQRKGFLNGELSPLHLTSAPLGDALPPLLPPLSSEGAALLADASGLCIAFCGFDALSARRLAACCAAVHTGIGQTLVRHAPRAPSGLCEVRIDLDASHYHACCLYVGAHKLHLAAAGELRLDSDTFTHLIALLSQRYRHREPGTCPKH